MRNRCNSQAIDLVLNEIANEQLVFLVNVHEIVFNAPHLPIYCSHMLLRQVLLVIGLKRLELLIENLYYIIKILSTVGKIK